MGDEGVSKALLAAVLLSVVVPTVGFWLGALTDGAGSPLAFGAVLAPLVVIAVLGAVLGRKVGSSPDEPEVVSDRLAEALGEPKEDLEEHFE